MSSSKKYGRAALVLNARSLVKEAFIEEIFNLTVK